MERVFLSQKGSKVGRGLKEKNIEVVKDGVIPSVTVDSGNAAKEVVSSSDGSYNDVGPVGDTSTVMEGVTPSMIDMTVEKEKLSSLEDTIVLESFSPLPTQVTTLAGNAPGKASYANITSKLSGKKVKVHTFCTPEGNEIDVVISVDSIRAISARFANTAYGFFLEEEGGIPYDMLENGPWFIRNNPLILKKWHPDKNLLKEDVSTVPIWVKLHGVPVTAFSEDGLSAIATKLGTLLMLDSYTSDMCMQSWGRSSYARVMIELRAKVELKDNIVVAMPKITKEGHYICNVRVEYEWKPPRRLSCKVFRHIHEEYLKNIGAGKKKTVKKPSQTSRGVPVGSKMGFKPQKEYQPVTKMPNASSSGNKKKSVKPTIEVSNSNLFDVLNSVDNDVEFGTNRGTTNLVNNGATSSGISSMNINNDGEFASNTPIVTTGIVKSDSEVEVVFDETANLKISTSGKDESYDTNSLLEQWRDSYSDNDNYEPYDDDMYENHNLSEYLQSICDDLDITGEDDGVMDLYENWVSSKVTCLDKMILFVLRSRQRKHDGGDTRCVSQPDWPAVIVINHYQTSQITAGQSGCDTQPDVPTLTCAPGAHDWAGVAQVWEMGQDRGLGELGRVLFGESNEQMA
ncbi:cytokinin dehydrogenase 3-like protein [Tanacetum coccineum]